MCEDYNLVDEKHLQFLRNPLRKNAHRFYLYSVKSRTKTYKGVLELPRKEYNSDVWKARVKNHLNRLRLLSHVNEYTDVAATIAKVYKSILTMSRQAPKSYRKDAQNIELLPGVVVRN